jgi:hypothetical protein
MLASAPLANPCFLAGRTILVTCKSWPLYLLVALPVGAAATASQGSPLGSDLRATSAAEHLQHVAVRHCWWQQGRRHCRGRGYQPQASDYYVHDANKLPFGSSLWWEQMLRENRAGNPGGGGGRN